MAEKKVIKDTPVILDYADHRNTRFEGCKLIYRGGKPPTLINNEFIRCEWIFENEAENTLHFLQSLMTGGGKELVLGAIGIKGNV